MENDLISKKDLLELTGISYGQLYRWKRKALIPEDWFIRKSTFTGQETFFPRDKILSRIDKIKNMKEDASLDEVADILSPNPADVHSDKDKLTQEKIVSAVAVDIFVETSGEPGSFDFEKILFVYILDKMLQSGEINSDEGKILIRTLDEHYASFEGKNCDLIFIRKLGVSSCLIVTAPNQIHFESATKIVGRQNITGCIEELKQKLSNVEITNG
ncbi:MAG TPA: YhbD family protein [Candidatus Acidoferrales bacterium]|nr:YhbD family protein [Candidatus Acidoferrales bacterium]